MATKAELLQALSFPTDEGSTNQVGGFTSRSMIQVYQGQIRAEASALGIDLAPIRIDDPDILDKLNAESQAIAESIGPTVNSMLENQIADLPEGLSVDEARAQLSDFFASVHAYNQNTLIPYASDFARQAATSDFYANNTTPDGQPLKDAVQWTWTQNSDFDDDCTEAQSASPDSYEALVGIAGDEPPVHRNCGCSLDPDSLDSADAPSADGLWTGQLSDQSFSFAEDIDLRKLKVCAFDLDDCALKFPQILVPVALMMAEAGVKIGVLTGNATFVKGGDAWVMWHNFGYPPPSFVERHTSKLIKLGEWKADMCDEHKVDLMIDDFRHGTFADVFTKYKPETTLALMPLLPKDAVHQEIGA